jgi:hypothetical protein
MSSLKFFVKEDGREFPVCEMSAPEGAAIGECVNDLIPYTTDSYWFEADTCLFDEDEAPYGILRCYTYNPTPKDGSMDESRIPHPFPTELMEALSGKTFRVHPRQLGLSPWGTKVELVFEAPSVSASVRVKGTKASALIAAALKK